MSKPTVKLTIPPSTTDEITRYIETEASTRATIIGEAIREAVDTYDYHAEIQKVCRQELDRFVRDTAATYFRRLLTSPEAHAAVLDNLNQQIRGGSNDHAPTTE